MKKQSGFTLIELLLVLAIIGIISAIAIPALLSQRARARDKTAISNMEGRVGDLVGQYDKLRETGSGNITAKLGSYLAATGGKDKNPWSTTGSGAFDTVVTSTTGTTQSAALAAVAPTVKGQAKFVYIAPTAGKPGFIAGGVLIDGKINGSSIIAKATAIE
jgi:prepilin-type N-terminal cleavage/methylation domain-containing protein